jgi:cytochrome c oxidase subunit IV
MATTGEHSHDNAVKVYMGALGALLLLTVITVAVAQVDFGSFNIVVAMLIASVKAGIVGLIFMHLRYESPLIWLYAGIPLFLLALMIAGIFIDNPFRDESHSPSDPVTSEATS